MFGLVALAGLAPSSRREGGTAQACKARHIVGELRGGEGGCRVWDVSRVVFPTAFVLL